MAHASAQRGIAGAGRAVHVRPTPVGFMLMIVLIGLWGGAISYQSNAALMILALILGGALVSGVHAWNNLRGIKVHATAGAGAFALEALTGTMIMDGGQQERSQLTAHLLHGRTGSLKLMLKLGTMEWVPPGKSACMDFTVPPQVRGRMTCTTARISSIYPFGLFRASIDVPVNLAWLIYPRPVMNAQDLLGCQSGVDLLHNDSALKDEAHAVSGGGDDFSGHRPYRDGDSQHHIDWRAVARGRPLLTKLYVHGTSGLRHIDWRQFVDDDLEHRLSRITGQVVDAKRAGVPFVLRLPDHMLDDHGDPGHYCACLSALALFGNG